MPPGDGLRRRLRVEPVAPIPGDWQGPGWVRFEGAAGTGMPFTPPPPHRCGGDATGWTTAPPPSIGDGVVAREVCFHFFDDECLWRTTARAAHCDEFLLYELDEVPRCHLRHCGADLDVAAWR